MRFLSVSEILEIQQRLLAQSGGLNGVRDLGALESAAAQPLMTFGGRDLYPGLIDKAAALGFSIVSNHPFVDGNKRAGHAAMEVFLILNGSEIEAEIEEQETIFLALAAGEMDRRAFTEWIKKRIVKIN